MRVAMSAAERQEFLAGVHVGVLTAAIGIAGQTLAVPVWYSYQRADVGASAKGKSSHDWRHVRMSTRRG